MAFHLDSQQAAGSPEIEQAGTGTPFPNYDVSLDGRQFLMTRSAPAAATGYVVVLNWHQELLERVPIP